MKEKTEAEMKEVIEIDPRKAFISPVNGRCGVPLEASEHKTLFESMRDEGQKVPVIGRFAPDDRFEIIAGSRRWGVALQLLQSNPEFRLKAQVVVANDKQAWWIAEAENAGRRDVTPRQRARSWNYALHHFCEGRQKDLAERLKKDPSVVCRTLKILEIPDDVFAILRDPEGVSVNFAEALVKALEDPLEHERILAEAKRFAQARVRFAPASLLRHLIGGADAEGAASVVAVPLADSPRQAVLRRDGRGGVTVRIRPLDEALSPRDCKLWFKKVETALRKELGLG